MQVTLHGIDERAPVRIRQQGRMTHEDFYEFCAANPDLRVELTAEGDIIIMPPAGAETGYRNSELARQLGNWSRQDGRGRAFDSNTEFLLPDGSALCPDASWVERTRLAKLTREQKRKFTPLVPDFIVELTSPSDRLPRVRKNMEAWIANGVKLGWLLDADRRMAYIYRPRRDDAEKLNAPAKLKGEGPVAGFVLDLAEIWDPDL
ncbi:MAG TPA: Uma2 family endonuclease [Bryobacteraceae bacterium]|nr:Uma2 family endonuclease [Bryobacteraceae bacterium]